MTGCLNGGSCSFNEEKDSFSCSCKLPWSGENCERGRSRKLFRDDFILKGVRSNTNNLPLKGKSHLPCALCFTKKYTQNF